MSLILIVAALVCFIIGAIPRVAVDRLAFVSAGLALYVAAGLVGRL